MKAKFNDYEMDLRRYITKHKRVNDKDVRIFELFARLDDLDRHRKFVKILQNDFRFQVDEEGIDLVAKTNMKQYTPCIPNEKSKISYVIHIEEIEKVEDTYGDKLIDDYEDDYEIVEDEVEELKTEEVVEYIEIVEEEEIAEIEETEE